MDEFDKARIELMRERIELLQERLRLRDAQLEVAQFDIDRLKEAISAPRPVPSAEPLFLSEHEEDIIHARNVQAISIAEAEDMLRELDFDSSEIVLDEPDTDLGLY
jgi:hypothetical protein